MVVENAVVARDRDQVMERGIDVDRRARGIAGGDVAGQRVAEIEPAEQIANQPVRSSSAERGSRMREGPNVAADVRRDSNFHQGQYVDGTMTAPSFGS